MTVKSKKVIIELVAIPVCARAVPDREPPTDSDQSEEDSDEEETGDFFTGESDNADFVSISSGSNPRRAPKTSWTCEHCTYVNNPGVSVNHSSCFYFFDGFRRKSYGLKSTADSRKRAI